MNIDFETYSEAGYFFDVAKNKWRAPDGFPKGKPGLPSIGAAKYAEHPSTEILSLAYDLKDGRGEILWLPHMPPPQLLFDHIHAGDKVHAYNTQFEFFIWHYVASARLGWPPLPLCQLRCAQARSAAWGLPSSLDKVTQVLKSYGY